MSRFGMRVVLLLITSFAMLPWCARGVSAKPAAAAQASEVRAAVRAYMETIDAGDLDGQMRFWSGDSSVTSVIMGEVWTGGASIRARSAEYVPVSKVMRSELGPITVQALGGGTMLTVTPYRPARREPANEKLKPYELDSMLTLVWTRSPDGWRIVHEHVSVKVPPPAAQ